MLDRAENRIEEAILFHTVSQKSPNDDVEISSFPIAVMMVAAADDPLIERRYALAEAKRVSGLLNGERKKKIMEIADNFKWKIRPVKGDTSTGPYDFALHFTERHGSRNS